MMKRFSKVFHLRVGDSSGPKTRRGAGPDEAGPAKAKVKEKGKQTVMEPQGTPGAPVSDGMEDGESDCSQAAHSEAEEDNPATGKGSKHAICSPEEGRLYLEEEAFIDPGEHIDLDAMAGTLVQVSLMADIPVPVGLVVRAVALILVQMKTEPPKANNGTGTTPSSSADAVTTKLEAHVKAMQEVVVSVAVKMRESMIEAAMAFQTQMETTAEKTLEGLHVVAQGISELMVKLTKTSTNYRNALLRQPPQAGPLNALRSIHFTPRLKAREGVRSQQILIDFKSNQGLVPFANDPITVLKGRFNKALYHIEDANGHKTRAVSSLQNGADGTRQ